MKIEVIASGRGSVTIKSDGDYSQAELLSLARSAARITTKLVNSVSEKKKPFGFEAGSHCEDTSTSWNREPGVMNDPEGEY